MVAIVIVDARVSWNLTRKFIGFSESQITKNIKSAQILLGVIMNLKCVVKDIFSGYKFVSCDWLDLKLYKSCFGDLFCRNKVPPFASICCYVSFFYYVKRSK